MASLAGKFAGLLRVDAPAAQVDALTAQLQALPGIAVQVTVVAETAVPDAAGTVVSVELVAPDHVGIVHQVSGALRALGVNVASLDTAITEASMAGGMLFEARAALHVPPGADVQVLGQRLHAVAEALAADIHIQMDL